MLIYPNHFAEPPNQALLPQPGSKNSTNPMQSTPKFLIHSLTLSIKKILNLLCSRVEEYAVKLKLAPIQMLTQSQRQRMFHLQHHMFHISRPLQADLPYLAPVSDCARQSCRCMRSGCFKPLLLLGSSRLPSIKASVFSKRPGGEEDWWDETALAVPLGQNTSLSG